jgi:hypothetical protein
MYQEDFKQEVDKQVQKLEQVLAAVEFVVHQIDNDLKSFVRKRITFSDDEALFTNQRECSIEDVMDSIDHMRIRFKETLEQGLPIVEDFEEDEVRDYIQHRTHIESEYRYSAGF